MKSVRLEDQEWNYIMGVLGDRPWRESNMILLKIGSQLRPQPFTPRPNGGINAPEGFSFGEDTRTISSRESVEIAQTDSSDSAQQREARSSKR